MCFAFIPWTAIPLPSSIDGVSNFPPWLSELPMICWSWVFASLIAFISSSPRLAVPLLSCFTWPINGSVSSLCISKTDRYYWFSKRKMHESSFTKHNECNMKYIPSLMWTIFKTSLYDFVHFSGSALSPSPIVLHIWYSDNRKKTF